jgi:hypothetical protein
MTADVSSAAAGDATDPEALATIPEDSKHEDAESHSKSHILVTTVNSTRISNAIEEMRAERLAMAIKDKATPRDKRTERMMAMLKKTQRVLTNSK